MGEKSVRTVCGSFTTREAADRALEHLVQQHGINRADIFIAPAGARNTSGTRPSGGDFPGSRRDRPSSSPRLKGRIEVTADVESDKVGVAETALREAGASAIENW